MPTAIKTDAGISFAMDVKIIVLRIGWSLVREEIIRTVSDAADVDAEIHELCEALIAAEGSVLP
jgi:hypothetical protein